MATNFIGGKAKYTKTVEGSLANATLTDFPPSAKAFKLHPNANLTQLLMITDGSECSMLLVSGDAGTVFPFRPEQLKVTTSDSSSVDIDYLY